jgi:hypothetical protein
LIYLALPLLDKDLIEFRQAADIAYYSVTRRMHEERERAIKNVEEDNEQERERIHETLLLQQQAVLEVKAAERVCVERFSLMICT